ncbi:MAG TPA: ABC transporter permease [Aggregatilineales bacterium]|nr:ABC transporter permease [Aggregatilineales bacterium]
MTGYIIRRVLLLSLTLLVTSALVFALTQIVPGDVARLILGRDASPEQIATFKAQFGLDVSPPQQYVNWLGRFIVGDWGRSFTGGNLPVRPLVLERLGNSMRLALMTLLLSVPLAVFLGMIAALRENTWIDGLVSIGSLAVVGLPEFVTALVLINGLALGVRELGLPSTSMVPNNTLEDWVRQLILPALTATFVLLGYIARLTRAGVLEELKKPYVRMATLKGLPRRVVIVKHVLRNALLPTITVIAISFGWLIGGLVVIETVFNYPGLGSLLVEAVKQKNLFLMQAIVMLVVTIYALANLAADLLYGVLNPRIRLG